MSYNRARVVDGHIVRDGGWGDGQFSYKRFLFVAALLSLLIITNPANELQDKAMEIVDLVQGQRNPGGPRRKMEQSKWAWNKMLDPPISVTNYGILAVEERHAKLTFLGLTQEWSCSYFDEQTGSFCSALARNLCHGKPLLHDPKNHAYTAHRTICYLLIASAILSFCYGGHFPAPLTTEPLMRAILNSFGRAHFSLLSLGLDLFNAAMHVYPALVRMERIVPTLQEGGIASHMGLPQYADFIFYVIVLVLILGGGSNALASHFSKQPCLGFDSTVAAAAGYCNAFSHLAGGGVGANTTTYTMFSPQTVLWAYLPVTAVLGGSSLAWILGGMLGSMLAQYHLDNQDLLLALRQSFLSVFK